MSPFVLSLRTDYGVGLCLVRMGVDFHRVGGAWAQQIRRRPSGYLGPRRLLRTGVEFGELGHPQLGGNRHPCFYACVLIQFLRT